MKGSDVKAQRKRLMVTQVEFANKIGVHPMTIYKWERWGDAVTLPRWAALLVTAYILPCEPEPAISGEGGQPDSARGH
jgi:DNA-binding XRE family transcriptional regulator